MRLLALILSSACLISALMAPMPSASAQGLVKAKFGDWDMRCRTPVGAAKQQCALVQKVSAEDQPNLTLMAVALKTADGKSHLLRVVVPLGVLLPSGLGLKIDGTDIGRVNFVRCIVEGDVHGCVAETVLDDKLLKQLESGRVATFIIFQTPEQGVGIPLQLKGFKQGYDSLP